MSVINPLVNQPLEAWKWKRMIISSSSSMSILKIPMNQPNLLISLVNSGSMYVTVKEISKFLSGASILLNASKPSLLKSLS